MRDIRTTSRLIALLAAVLVVAAACGDGGGAAEDAEGGAGGGDAEGDAAGGDAEAADEVALSLWLFGDFGYDPLIETYQDMHPHVEITTQISEFADHHDALTTTLAAGSGAPDIVAIEVGYIAAYKDNPEHFHNLLDFGAAEVEGDYLDWKWDQATTIDGDAVIALPTDVGGMAMCYRQDLFAEAGLPSDRDELARQMADWDSYLDLGRRYVEATGRAWANNGAVIFQAAVGQGEETYYDAGGELIYDSNPVVRQAFDIAADAIEDGLTANIALWTGEWNAGMADGTYATLTCPAWMRGHMQGQEPPEGAWDITALPGGGGNWGGSFLALPEHGEHPEEAYDFVSWLLAPEQQLTVFEGTGNFPSTPGLYDAPQIQEFTAELFGDAPFGEIFAENARRVASPPLGPQYELIRTEFENGLGRIADGEETREEAWASAVAAADRLTGRD